MSIRWPNSFDWTDIALHAAAAAAMVFLGGIVLTQVGPGLVWAWAIIVAFFWFAREWWQHRHDEKWDGAQSHAEYIAPAIVSFVTAWVVTTYV